MDWGARVSLLISTADSLWPDIEMNIWGSYVKFFEVRVHVGVIKTAPDATRCYCTPPTAKLSINLWSYSLMYNLYLSMKKTSELTVPILLLFGC